MGIKNEGILEGWAIKGQKVYGEVSGKRYARESFIAGLNNGKIIAPFCYKGTCDKNLIEQANCMLIFLPAYSPDLNPFKKFWANLKNKIKKIISNFSTLADAVDYLFCSIN